MFQSVVKMLGAILGPGARILEKELAIRYLKKVHELQKDRDEEIDKDSDPDPKIRTDHNVLGHIDRSILRLNDLVAIEIKRSQANNLHG